MDIYKFQVAEKDLSPAAPDCTARIHHHHKKFADHDLLRFLCLLHFVQIAIQTCITTIDQNVLLSFKMRQKPQRQPI